MKRTASGFVSKRLRRRFFRIGEKETLIRRYQLKQLALTGKQLPGNIKVLLVGTVTIRYLN